MRRSKITGLLLIMGMFLAGCGANSGSAGIEEDAVMQELYDRSERIHRSNFSGVFRSI